MSGFWRNLLTVLIALWQRDARIMHAGCACRFWVSPLDVGVRTLKSDKYLQLAESAQLDFGLRSGLQGRMRRARCAMVNMEQQVQFFKPILLFDIVTVTTRIAHADAKWFQVEHQYMVRNQHCATVTVKAKFKAGRMTVPANELLGLNLSETPPATPFT